MKNIIKGIVSTGVALSAMTSVAFANPTTVQSTLTGQKEVTFNGSPISNPYGRVYANTMYMPIWYVGQAMESIPGVKVSWNGGTHVWNITVPTNLPKDCFSIPKGAGDTTIDVNGQTIKMVDTFAAIDPTSKRATVYMPIFYVQQILWSIGVLNTWDGQNWDISYNPNATATVDGTGNSTSAGTTNTVNSDTNGSISGNATVE